MSKGSRNFEQTASVQDHASDDNAGRVILYGVAQEIQNHSSLYTIAEIADVRFPVDPLSFSRRDPANPDRNVEAFDNSSGYDYVRSTIVYFFHLR